MYLNWLQSLVYGLIAGLTDILPISSQAHQTLLLKMFGVKSGMELMDLMIHVGIAAAMYVSSQKQIVRMSRARALARIPKRRRKRPLDEKSLMDYSLLRTMFVPVLLGVLLYQKALGLQQKLIWIALALFVNGVVQYIPQFFPGSNRDSRLLSRVDGLMMGLGGGLSVIPGLSAVGLATAVASMVGVERMYALNMALLMNLTVNLGLVVQGILLTASAKLPGLTFAIAGRCVAAGLMAFVGSVLTVRMMRKFAQEHDNGIFGLYCVGLAMFLFILNLMA